MELSSLAFPITLGSPSLLEQNPSIYSSFNHGEFLEKISVREIVAQRKPNNGGRGNGSGTKANSDVCSTISLKAIYLETSLWFSDVV